VKIKTNADSKGKAKSFSEQHDAKEKANQKKLGEIFEMMTKTELNFIFFFDNVDKLLEPEDRKFISFCEGILSACENAKVLITAREMKQKSNIENPLVLSGFKEDK
jgi:hypothetical protein